MEITRDFIFDSALVLYLPLYKLDGANIASQDARGYLCTVTGALWTPSGRDFDGVDDRITIGTLVTTVLNGTSAITILAWIKNDDLPGVGALRPIWESRVFDVAGIQLTLVEGSKIRFGGRSVSTDAFQYDETVTYDTTGTWRQVGVILDFANDLVIGIIDGLEVVSKAVTFANTTYTIGSPDANDTIGANAGATVFFNGLIGEVFGYNKRVFPPEYQRLYLETKWRYR